MTPCKKYFRFNPAYQTTVFTYFAFFTLNNSSCKVIAKNAQAKWALRHAEFISASVLPVSPYFPPA